MSELWTVSAVRPAFPTLEYMRIESVNSEELFLGFAVVPGEVF